MADSYIVSFYDLFNCPLEIQENEELRINKVVIPLIQRDYAQGRKTYEVNRIRLKFLQSLYDSITMNNPINLDFVYGDIDSEGKLTPLDGQQRLTTLFLLHWYAGKKDRIDDEKYIFLQNFSYETRYSARYFCDELIKFSPYFDKKISDEIIDQSWFPLDWQNDQTISSMLVMIDEIDEKFKDVKDLWKKLVEDKLITFYFLPIKNLGLSDELYIKMNSRGKPLTRFEHFKAELEAQIAIYDKDVAKRISHKIDLSWTDMLWCYRDEDQIDYLFLNLFKFICDVICYEEGGSTTNRSYDEFELVDIYYNHNNVNIKRHIDLMEMIFDGFASFQGNTAQDLFEKFLSKRHEVNKVKVYNIADLDLFKDCLYNYSDKLYQRRSRAFPISKLVLLYAFTIYVINKNSISDNDIVYRIRTVYNLIQNSDDEINSDSETRQGGNRIPEALLQVKSIIIDGNILESNKISFNDEQMKEEKRKKEWREHNSEYISALEKLEDSEYVRGQMSFLDLNHPENFSRFLDLFNCNLDKINCALLAKADYSRVENGCRHSFGTNEEQYAATVWRFILHKSRADGFENVKGVLDSFLQDNDNINDSLLDSIINNYLLRCEESNLFDWRYYMIKYPSFRPNRYGKYWFVSRYKFYALYTEKKLSENTYQPFLNEIHSKLDRDDCGKRGIVGDFYLYCDDDGFYLRDSDNVEIASLRINQTQDGIDKEDRILKYKNNPLTI